MEAKRNPFTASQFHPEKAAFEWTPTLHIPHTPDAISMSQEIGNFILTQANGFCSGGIRQFGGINRNLI
jgi:gamma-glutamyl hydrolase